MACLVFGCGSTGSWIDDNVEMVDAVVDLSAQGATHYLMTLDEVPAAKAELVAACCDAAAALLESGELTIPADLASQVPDEFQQYLVIAVAAWQRYVTPKFNELGEMVLTETQRRLLVTAVAGVGKGAQTYADSMVAATRPKEDEG